MGEILELAEKLWNGETDTFSYHPLGPPRGIERIAADTWLYKGFANTIIRETEAGLVLVDPGGLVEAPIKHKAIRSVTRSRLNTAVFTHGHLDHVFGIPLYREEPNTEGWPMPRVIAHEALPGRFNRYRETQMWNAYVNLRQFRGGVGEAVLPIDFHYPDITYRDKMTMTVGSVNFVITHARGETDDHSWVFFPDRGVLCTGDLFIYAIPNAGNPQKVQRYAGDWVKALREMSALEPEILAPGHGVPIIGADRVKQALEETAMFMEVIHEQTLHFMNQGLPLDQVLHSVKAPEDLQKRPYLKPVYDEPEFIVRNIWRLYGGWYDGTPSHLKPAREKSQAEEIARLAGGGHRLAERADELLELGDFRLACHLIDWAYLASPGDVRVQQAAERVYQARAAVETSTMAIGIYQTAARLMSGKKQETGVEGNIILEQVERARKR